MASDKTTTKVKAKKTVEPKVSAKAVKETSATSSDKSKMRVRVSAYEHKILDASVRQIMDTAGRYDAVVEGPIPLPTGIKKYTVNRGAFIDKNAREQFEMRIHRRLIDIVNPSPKVIESLTNLSLPSGVNVDVKMM